MAPTPTDPHAIIVLEESANSDDPGEIVGSNVWFVNTLFDALFTDEEIAPDAIRSYYVDYYLAQVHNGGFSQFVYNCHWDPKVVNWVREGLQAIGAKKHLAVFDGAAELVKSFDEARLAAYFESEYFGENPERDELNAPNDAIEEAEDEEDLTELNAVWLRSHANLVAMETEDQMFAEIRRRSEALPDREKRIEEARSNAPRYVKLIRALCAKAGHELERITAGDPTRVHEGEETVAWHFFTDEGHHHMIEADGKAIMYREFTTTDPVCEIDAPEEKK